jgi:hypothetical protein
MSSGGIVPPMKTATSPAPRALSNSTTFGPRVRWLPHSVLSPTTEAPSSSAASTMSSGKLLPRYTTSFPASLRKRETITAPRQWISRPSFAISILPFAAIFISSIYEVYVRRVY